MKAILALAVKDLLLLWRDKFALFWILAFPLMFALFFGSIFKSGDGGGRRALSLAVVDQDESPASRGLVGRLEAHASVRLPRAGSEPDAPLERPTLEQAREAVRKGDRVAYLLVPKGYGDNPFAVFGAGDETAPELEIGIDPGRRAEAGFLQGIMMEVVMGSLRDRFLDRDQLKLDLAAVTQEIEGASDLSGPEKLALRTLLGSVDKFVGEFDLQRMSAAGRPDGKAGTSGGIRLVDVTRDTGGTPRSAFDVSFPQAVIWGLMSVALGFAITLVRERSGGTLLRLRLAPISRAQVLAGKALACFLGSMATMIVMLGFGALALGVRFDSLPLLVVAMLASSTCMTGLMMTISVMGKTEAAVAGSSWGLLMPMAMIGGGMIPLIAMPSWLAKLSVISPFKWAITALEGAAWRGFTPADMVTPAGILVGMGALFFLLGVGIFRKLDA
jgi:ABC-2 type transport system permease protein